MVFKVHCTTYTTLASVSSLREFFNNRQSRSPQEACSCLGAGARPGPALVPSPLDRFENIVPNFFPTRCFVFFEFPLLVSLSNLSDQRVEDIIHVAPVSGAGLVEGAVELVSK